MSGKKGTSKHGKIEKSPNVNSSTPLSTESQTSPINQDSQNGQNSGVHQDLLDPDDVNILKIIVREYKAHRIDFTVLPPRPRFKPPRINTGIICNAEIRRRASAKAKVDPNATGGSLSSLTELLLWKYLGCPSDVVRTGPEK